MSSLYRAKHKAWCNSTERYDYTCYYTQDSVMKMLSERGLHKDKYLLLLATDGQRPLRDDTFQPPVSYQLRNRISGIQPEMCMMLVADIHMGNPMSSMDYILAHWRSTYWQGSKTPFPEQCYIQHSKYYFAKDFAKNAQNTDAQNAQKGIR